MAQQTSPASSIEEFMKSDTKSVKIDFSMRDFKYARVCRSLLGVAAKHSGHSIKASLRKRIVYLSNEN